MSKLRENLKKAMDDRKWNAYDMEQYSRVPQPTTQRFLSGKQNEPRSTTVQKWAQALNMDEAELRGIIPAYINNQTTNIIPISQDTHPISNATWGSEFDLWDKDTPLRVLPDGCPVGIDTSKVQVTNGDWYAIDHHGELRIKIMYKLPGGGYRLRSFNSDEWPDESPVSESDLRVLGRVFWWSGLR